MSAAATVRVAFGAVHSEGGIAGADPVLDVRGDGQHPTAARSTSDADRISGPYACANKRSQPARSGSLSQPQPAKQRAAKQRMKPGDVRASVAEPHG